VLIEDAASQDWAEILGRIDRPVFLALGVKDFIAPPTLWDGVQLPPLAWVELFERSGHQPFHDEPTLFVSAIKRWLAGAEAPAT